MYMNEYLFAHFVVLSSSQKWRSLSGFVLSPFRNEGLIKKREKKACPTISFERRISPCVMLAKEERQERR